MEWILIIAAIAVIFFISSFLIKKWITPKINPKIRLLLSFVCFAVLISIFLIHDIGSKNFTVLQQTVLIAFSIGYFIWFYYRYKKIKSKTG
jgi:uncharacterized membrane protein YoaK (UPF0700 family)